MPGVCVQCVTQSLLYVSGGVGLLRAARWRTRRRSGSSVTTGEGGADQVDHWSVESAEGVGVAPHQRAGDQRGHRRDQGGTGEAAPLVVDAEELGEGLGDPLLEGAAAGHALGAGGVALHQEHAGRP